MKHADELTLPATPATTGDALSPDAALTALTTNDTHEGGEGIQSPSDNGASGRALPNGRETERHPGDDHGGREPNGEPAAPAQNGAKPISKRRLARMGKSQLVELYLAERDKVSTANGRAVEATQAATVAGALSDDVIDQSIDDMAGDAIGLIDAAAQLSVGEKYAAAVALDDDESARLKMLAGRVAKVRARSQLAKAGPEIALCFSVACIGLSKFIAYKLAVKESAKP